MKSKEQILADAAGMEVEFITSFIDSESYNITIQEALDAMESYANMKISEITMNEFIKIKNKAIIDFLFYKHK